MNNLDVCGVVVLYYPDDKVAENIASYAEVLDKLYIVDNSTGASSFSISNFLCETVLLSSGENRGVAAALNIALEQALDDGYQWMLTMDQDGSFEPRELAHLLECRHSLPLNNPLLVSPVHSKRFSVQSEDCHCKDVDVVMTSGNLVYVNKANNIGGYDSRFFIDEVDHEFCLRGEVAGYKVVSLVSAYVNHQLGVSHIKNNKRIRLYTPERLYYMMRNYLYLQNKYHPRNPEFFKTRTQFLKKFFYQHLRFSPQRLQCFLMLLKGWYDYKKNRFGSIHARQ